MTQERMGNLDAAHVELGVSRIGRSLLLEWMDDFLAGRLTVDDEVSKNNSEGFLKGVRTLRDLVGEDVILITNLNNQPNQRRTRIRYGLFSDEDNFMRAINVPPDLIGYSMGMGDSRRDGDIEARFDFEKDDFIRKTVEILGHFESESKVLEESGKHVITFKQWERLREVGET